MHPGQFLAFKPNFKTKHRIELSLIVYDYRAMSVPEEGIIRLDSGALFRHVLQFLLATLAIQSLLSASAHFFCTRECNSLVAIYSLFDPCVCCSSY